MVLFIQNSYKKQKLLTENYGIIIAYYIKQTIKSNWRNKNATVFKIRISN